MTHERTNERTNDRTNEVYLPMNGVNNDWLPVQAEAHQSWPPKKLKKTDKLTKRERQRKKEKKQNTLLYIQYRYKEKLDTRITSPHIRPHIVSEIQS